MGKGKPIDSIEFDSLIARDILSKLKLSATQISRDLGKGNTYISQTLKRGTIRKRDVELLKKVYNVDLTPAFIKKEEPQEAKTEPQKETEIIMQLCTDHIIDAIGEHKENSTNDADRIVQSLLRIEGLLGKIMEKLS